MLFLATMNIIGYLTTGAYECLLVFSVAYAGVNHLCKNQTCAILGGLFAANFLWGCGRVKETFVETMKDSTAHAMDSSASATKAALEAMKEFKTNPTQGSADTAKAAQDAAAKAAAAAADIAKNAGDDKACKGASMDGYTFKSVMKDGKYVSCNATKNN